MASLRISTAVASDLPQVLDILDEAARWLASQGIHQWESPPPPHVRSLFEIAIAKREVYLVSQPESSETIGTFRFDYRHAPFWPDRKDAGFLYTLALRPDFIGHGFGSAIIQWVCEEIRAHGQSWLRLDVIAGNVRLRQWYEDLGFEFRGVAVVEGYELALYELNPSRTLRQSDGGATPCE